MTLMDAYSFVVGFALGAISVCVLVIVVLLLGTQQ